MYIPSEREGEKDREREERDRERARERQRRGRVWLLGPKAFNMSVFWSAIRENRNFGIGKLRTME